MKVSLIILVVAATTGSRAASTPTFNADVAPIVFNKCTSCHRTGEAAPFELLSYRDVQKRGKLIAKVVRKGFMPPWHIQSKDYHFANDRPLSEGEINTIERWVAGGMPEGDKSRSPKLPEFTDGWQLGAPDLVVKMKAPYTLYAQGPDIYRQFVIPLALKEDKWIRAIEFRPGQRSVVHHCLYYYDVTGMARKLDAAEPKEGFRRLGKEFRANAIGGWAVGGAPQELPVGLAYHLPAGADLVLSTHFHPSGKEENEVSTLGIHFADKPPTQGFTALQLPPLFGALAGIMIPAGDANYVKEDSFELPVAVKAFGVNAHAHYLGKSMEMTAQLPTGEKKELLKIPDWDFSWQEEYRFVEEVYLPAGTKLSANVVWDNSKDNIYNPNNPPKPVRWGRESDDEMGSVTLMVTAANPGDLSDLKNKYRQHVRQSATQTIANRFAGGKEGQSGSLLKRIMERFDKDKDGKLSEKERAEARKFYRGNRF